MVLIKKEELLRLIKKEINKVDGDLNSKKRNIIQRRIYKYLPKEQDELIKLFDELVKEDQWSIFWMVTQWIKRKKLYKKEYMEIYEDWLYNNINTWGFCDVFCYII
jgi:hypothetical protein